MNELTCRQLIDFIADYREGRLEEGVRTVFESHLDECPPCKKYLDTYETTADLVRKACCEGDEESGGGGGERPPKAPEALIQAILAAKKEASKE